MRYLHTMVRISNVEASLAFYCGLLGLEEVRRSRQSGGTVHADLPFRAC